jgi:hypothetical protein
MEPELCPWQNGSTLTIPSRCFPGNVGATWSGHSCFSYVLTRRGDEWFNEPVRRHLSPLPPKPSAQFASGDL